MKTIALIYGTRPEYLKLQTIIKNFECYGYELLVIQTGQQNFTIKGVQSGKYYKNISLSNRLTKILLYIESIYNKNHFDGIIVQGDTLSTYCGAVFGFLNKIPVFHVEAGLRTFDLENPFPEEGFRQMISRMTSIHFTPTKQATKNLLREGISKSKIIQVGNTFVDYMREIDCTTSNEIILTCHRKENIENIPIICEQLNILAKYCMDRGLPYTFTVIKHPNKSIAKIFEKYLLVGKNVKLIDPLEHTEMMKRIAAAYLVLTDSGGIQEEVAILRKPTFVLRKLTERMESVKSGSCKVIDMKIIENVKNYINDRIKFKIKECKAYGTFCVSDKIIQNIVKFFEKESYNKRKE